MQKILDVSYRLFLDQGYDHTTIQDIVDALGMSKGAVYHHFKSKEDILDKLSNRYYDEVHWFQEIRRKPGLTGLQKMREIMIMQMSDQRKLELDGITLTPEKNPQFVVLALDSSIHDAAPFCVALIEEGIRDGSIHTEHPRELAEVFMLLINIWVGLFSEGREDFLRKLRFLRELTDRMGMPVINDELEATAEEYFNRILRCP